MSDSNWSDWLDFRPEMFAEIPESSGVFMMHAAMKILFIGGSKNMKKSVEEIFSEDRFSKSTRFRYRIEDDFEDFKQVLVTDFKKRHEGQLPYCMN